MEKYDLYKDMQKRMGGKISIGIAGPAKSGKSVFVRRLAEYLTLQESEHQAKPGEEKEFHIEEQNVNWNQVLAGIVVTSDGSFGEQPGNGFADEEKEAIRYLKKMEKPFLVIVNSVRPYSDDAKIAAEDLRKRYDVTCMVMNCEQAPDQEISSVLEELLLEFPLTRIVFRIPRWAETLEHTHWLRQELFEGVRMYMKGMKSVRDIYSENHKLESKNVKRIKAEEISMASGTAEVSVEMPEALYYEILSEMTGTEIRSEYQLISLVREMSRQKKEYEEVSAAVSAVRHTGYGMITPRKEEICMEEPVLTRQGNRYGVRIRAVSPSIHLIKAEIETEIAPIVGSEEQARDLLTYIKANQNMKDGAWNTLIFGKSIEQMLEEGILAKLSRISDENQQKLQDTMKRIVNDTKGKLICIIL